MKRPGSDTITGYLFLAPSLAVLGVFCLYPIALAGYMSFFKCDFGGTPQNFIGTANYTEAFADGELWDALSVTLAYAVGTIPVTLILSFVIANLLFRNIRGRAFYRAAYFLPFVTSAVAAAAVWKWVFHPQVASPFGIANVVLTRLGLSGQTWLLEPRGIFTLVAQWLGFLPPSWITGPSLALCCVMACAVWHAVGFNVVIFMAGLSNIPSELYDAAHIDGAGSWRTAWNITLPMVSPTLYFLLMISTIGAFQAFTSIYVMTAGGPVGTTRNITMLIYENFYVRHGTTGYAAALAMILFVLILVVTGVLARLAGRQVHYEGTL